jgi:membrane protein insertase Oxa1/YidC/SpoIIIJ
MPAFPTLRLASPLARAAWRRPAAQCGFAVPGTRRISGATAAAGAGAPSAVAAAASLGAPAQFVAAAQAATGAPWWLAIGGSAIVLRVALLPLLCYQLRESRRLAEIAPQLRAIRLECASLSPLPRRAWTTAGRMYRACRAASVQPLALVAVPLLQILALVYSVVSVRRMSLPGSPLAAQMQQGGPRWHPDLTRADGRWILPMASTLLLLSNLQLAIPSAASPLMQSARNAWQAAAVVAFPMFAELPAGASGE